MRTTILPPPPAETRRDMPRLISQLRNLAEERTKLSDVVDRIAFDNQWKEGVPVGLLLMVVAAMDREKQGAAS